MAGFGRIMKEEKNSEIKDSMLDYFVSLFDDANDFSWDAAKASHAVLLCRMEQGEIRNYTELEKIDRIRRAHAQRHNQPPPKVIRMQIKQVKETTNPCPVFSTTKGHVISPKHMKHVEFCIDIYVLSVSPMVRLSVTVKLNAKTS